MTTRPTLIPTILCGGAGSRLWPVSRALHPKPFIELADGESLLQKAFLRGARLPGVEEVLTVTNRELLFQTEDAYDAVMGKLGHAPRTDFILEPCGRNTAAAIAAACLQAQKTHGDEAQLLVLAADHLIEDQAAFEAAVERAGELAAEGGLVTFGIRPDRPETGYGYIEADGERVVQFVEKPSLERAEAYLEAGRFLWNSGMFCFRVGTMLDELEAHSPEILESVRECLSASREARGERFSHLELDAAIFARVPEESIDYAVMENTGRGAVVACEIGWSDIGSWSSLGEMSAADEQGNRVEGEALIHDTQGCFIRSEDRLVGAVGVENLIVVDTPDALLVADSSRAQDVKHLYAELKERDHEAHRLHRTVYRPWGSYTILDEAERYKIKRLAVKPGGRLSLQKHHHRSEHWVVVRGVARVTNEDEVIELQRNESTFIPAGHIHRLENPGVVDLVIIEVQSGEYLGEDDIVRVEDIYGRLDG